MNYTYIVRLPKHLETAYHAGKILISGGVARDIHTKQIIAHLEQVSAFANTNTFKAANTGSPHLVMIGMAIDIAKISKDIGINTQKINQILNLVEQLKILSCINMAIVGVNLGVNIIGFYLVINKLNQLSQQLDRIDNKINAIITHENRNILKQIKIDIKDAITFVSILEEKKINDSLDSEIQRHFNRLETNIQDLVDRYKNKELVSVSLDYIQTAYNAYCNLFKAYTTAKYLIQEPLHTTLKLRTLENIKNQIISREVLTSWYEALILNQEKMLTEPELDIIFYLYKNLCQESYERVSSHIEILLKTPVEKFQSWKLKSSPTEPIIWVIH